EKPWVPRKRPEGITKPTPISTESQVHRKVLYFIDLRLRRRVGSASSDKDEYRVRRPGLVTRDLVNLGSFFDAPAGFPKLWATGRRPTCGVRECRPLLQQSRKRQGRRGRGTLVLWQK